ncbi:MAG: triose-phosphate isomerase [Syntrophales bacterium]|nr:triose-phosphate isomerase [Syntrophales bacterium]
MARTVIAGNWKMNKTIGEAVAFAADLCKALADKPDLPEIIIAPPFTALQAVSAVISGSSISLAAQNIHEADKGAFTGEISGGMLREAGCRFVIIGHSERRILFGEENERLNKKLVAALGAGLNPIFCIGESLQNREENRMEEVIGEQLKEGLNNLDDNDIRRILIAYEPVWAIGTGKTAAPSQAQEMHRFIRNWIAGRHSKELSEETVILYGGSVTPQNVALLMSQPDINGALVGGASLDVESFVRIVEYKSNQGV